jgi:hypothetical protein
VDPTVDTVTSAISEVIDNLKSNYLGLDVLNGNLSGSWPMCMISFVLVYTSVSSTDCSYMQGLLAFLAWSQLNPHVISEVETELNLAPLPFGYKRLAPYSPPLAMIPPMPRLTLMFPFHTLAAR